MRPFIPAEITDALMSLCDDAPQSSLADVRSASRAPRLTAFPAADVAAHPLPSLQEDDPAGARLRHGGPLRMVRPRPRRLRLHRTGRSRCVRAERR